MLFAIRLPRTEVTLVCYKRKQCRLSVKRRRSSQNSAGCTNKDARLWPASVPVGRGLKCVKRAKRKLYMRSTKNARVLQNASVNFCCYSFGVSSSAFAADFGASASAAGASAFASASAMGAAVASSSTTDCCTNCSFSSAVRI